MSLRRIQKLNKFILNYSPKPAYSLVAHSNRLIICFKLLHNNNNVPYCSCQCLALLVLWNMEYNNKIRYDDKTHCLEIKRTHFIKYSRFVTKISFHIRRKLSEESVTEIRAMYAVWHVCICNLYRNFHARTNRRYVEKGMQKTVIIIV